MNMTWIKRQWSRLRAFLDDHIDPAEQLAQIMVGVIMAMSITIYARSTLRPPQQEQGQAAASSDDDDPTPMTKTDLIQAVFGCNLAWGVITGVMYLMNSMYDRSLPARLQREIRRAADDDAEALDVVEGEFDDTLLALTTEEQRARLYAQIVEKLRADAIPRPRLQWKDVTIALIILFLVVITAVPTLIPFLFTDDMLVALRVANGMLIVILFGVGYCWGRVVLLNAWVAGVAIMLLGIVMAAVAEYFGG